MAVIGRHYHSTRTLLEHGANVNALCSQSLTPLGLACRACLYRDDEAFSLAQLLLRWGADKMASDCHGLTIVRRLQKMPNSPDALRQFEALRTLLAGAPAARAWGRRGLVVLCRAFPHRAGLLRRGLKDAAPVDERKRAWPRASGCSHRMKTAKVELDVGFVVSVHGRVVHDLAGPAAAKQLPGDQKVANQDDLGGLLARVVTLETDIVFRKIVGFL